MSSKNFKIIQGPPRSDIINSLFDGKIVQFKIVSSIGSRQERIITGRIISLSAKGESLKDFFITFKVGQEIYKGSFSLSSNNGEFEKG